MKSKIISSFTIFLICSFANSQVAIVPDSQKFLDSIVAYNYNSSYDSIRRSKVEYKQFDGGRHISLHYYRWQESASKWLADYTLLQNKIDLFFDNSGNVERETKHLWNSANLTYTRLSETNRDYNPYGNLIYEINEIWDMHGIIQRGHFMNFEYDSNNRMVFENKCDWSENIINWWGKYQYTYEYDSLGNKVQCNEFIWDSDERFWANHQKEEWRHDGSGAVINYIKYSWDDEQKEWTGTVKIEREINTAGSWHIETSYSWDALDSLWIGDVRKVRSFDSRGNWTLELNRKWNPGIASWKEASKQARTFDLNDNILIDEIYSWDLQKNSWKGYSKKEKEYDNSGNPLVIIDYLWNSVQNNWIDNHRTEFAYNSSGIIISEAHYNWTMNTWQGSEKKSWIFDSDEDLIVEYDYLWSSVSGNFEKNKAHFYYYGNTSSLADISADINIKIYPNPSIGIINISGLNNPAEISILSIQGNIIKTFQQVESTIDISELSGGIYFLNIISNRMSFVRKIVVTR